MNMGNSIQPMSDCNSMHATSSLLEDTAENKFYALQQITGKLCMEGVNFTENNYPLISNSKQPHKVILGDSSEKENELMQYDGLGDTQQKSLQGSTTLFNERQVGILRELLKDQEDITDENELLRSFKRVVVSTGGRRQEFSQEQIDAYKRELMFNSGIIQQEQQQQQQKYQQQNQQFQEDYLQDEINHEDRIQENQKSSQNVQYLKNPTESMKNGIYQIFQDCKGLDDIWMNQSRIKEEYDTQQQDNRVIDNFNYIIQNHLSKEQHPMKITNEWEKQIQEQKKPFGQQSPLMGDCSISCLSNNVEYTSRIMNSKLNQDSLVDNDNFKVQMQLQSNKQNQQILNTQAQSYPNDMQQQPQNGFSNMEMFKQEIKEQMNFNENHNQSTRNNRFQGQANDLCSTADLVFPKNQSQKEDILPAKIKVIPTVNKECVPNPIKKLRSFSGNNVKGDRKHHSLYQSLDTQQNNYSTAVRRMSQGNTLPNNLCVQINKSNGNNLTQECSQILQKQQQFQLPKHEQPYLNNICNHQLAPVEQSSDHHHSSCQISSEDVNQNHHSNSTQLLFNAPKYPNNAQLPYSSSHSKIPAASEFRVQPPESLTSMLHLCSKPPIETPTYSTAIIFDNKNNILPPAYPNSLLPSRSNSIQQAEKQLEQSQDYQQDILKNDNLSLNLNKEQMLTQIQEIHTKHFKHEQIPKQQVSVSSSISSLKLTVEIDSGIQKKTIKGIRKSRESSLDGSFIRPQETDRFQLAGFHKIKSIHITEEDLKGNDSIQSSQESFFRDRKRQFYCQEQPFNGQLQQPQTQSTDGRSMNYPLECNQPEIIKPQGESCIQRNDKGFKEAERQACVNGNISSIIISTQEAAYYCCSSQKEGNCSEKKLFNLKAATPMKQEEEEEGNTNLSYEEEEYQILGGTACLYGQSGIANLQQQGNDSGYKQRSDLKLSQSIEINKVMQNEIDQEKEPNHIERVSFSDSQQKQLAVMCRTIQSTDPQSIKYAEQQQQDENHNAEVDSLRNLQETAQLPEITPKKLYEASKSPKINSYSDKDINDDDKKITLNTQSTLHFEYNRIQKNLNQLSINNRNTNTADILSLSRKIKTPSKDKENVQKQHDYHQNDQLHHYQQEQQQQKQIEGQFDILSNEKHMFEGCLADELTADCEHAEKLLFRSESYYLSPQIHDIPDQSLQDYQSKKDLEVLKIMHMLDKTTSNGQQNNWMQKNEDEKRQSLQTNGYAHCGESNQNIFKAEINNVNQQRGCQNQQIKEQNDNNNSAISQDKLEKRSLKVLQEQSINVQLDFNTPVTSNKNSNVSSASQLHQGKSASCSGFKQNCRQYGVVDTQSLNVLSNNNRNNYESIDNLQDYSANLIREQSSKYHTIIQQQKSSLQNQQAKINSSRTSRKNSVEQHNSNFNSIQGNNNTSSRSSMRQIDYIEVFQSRQPSKHNGLINKDQKQSKQDQFQDYQNMKIQQRQATHQKVSQLYNQHKAAILIESKNKKVSDKTRQLSAADSRKKPNNSSHTSYSKLDVPNNIPRNSHNNYLERQPQNQLSEIVQSLNEQVRFNRPILEIIKQSSQAPLPRQQQQQRIQSSNRSMMNFK